MVYLVGVIGFIGGFIIGQFLLLYLLRRRSKEDLLNDRFLRWKYGSLNWMLAGVGAYSFVIMYKAWFG